MHHRPEQAETARTYEPPRRPVSARKGVELCRAVPLLPSALLANTAVLLLQKALDVRGLTAGVPT